MKMAILHCNKVSKFHVDSIGAATFQKTGFTITNTQSGAATIQNIFTVATVAETGTNLDYDAFTFNSAQNQFNFYMAFHVGGVDAPYKYPGFMGEIIWIELPSGGSTDEEVAEAIVEKITNGYSETKIKLSEYFTATNSTNTVTITNIGKGLTTVPLDGGDTTYELDNAQDGTSTAILNLKTVTGWVYETKSGGSAVSMYKRQKYMKLILNLDDPTISWSY